MGGQFLGQDDAGGFAQEQQKPQESQGEEAEGASEKEKGDEHRQGQDKRGHDQRFAADPVGKKSSGQAARGAADHKNRERTSRDNQRETAQILNGGKKGQEADDRRDPQDHDGHQDQETVQTAGLPCRPEESGRRRKGRGIFSGEGAFL